MHNYEFLYSIDLRMYLCFFLLIPIKQVTESDSEEQYLEVQKCNENTILRASFRDCHFGRGVRTARSSGTYVSEFTVTIPSLDVAESWL